MSNSSDSTGGRFDDAFEEELKSQLRVAVAPVMPDVEHALQSVHRASSPSVDRSQRFLAVAAAIALIGAGAVGLSRVSSTSEDVFAEPAVTTAGATPSQAVSTTVPPMSDDGVGDDAVGGVSADPALQRRAILAAEVPPISSPLAGGDALRVTSALSGPGSGQPFVSVEVFADIGEVLTADALGGPYNRRFDSSLFARRDVLSQVAGPAEWRQETLNAGGFVSPDATVTVQNDRLWDDAWDLLVSGTLTDAQRSLLFEAIEVELGVSYAIVVADQSSSEIVEVSWNGHSENEPRTLSLDAASGAPTRYTVGVENEDVGFSAVIAYEAERVAVAELDIAQTPPTEEPNVASQAVALDGDGILAIEPESGDSVVVPFGSPRADVVALIEMSYGPPGSESLLEECGGGPLTSVNWGSFSVYFDGTASSGEGAAFAGWALDNRFAGPVIATGEGLGLGSTVDAIVTARSAVLDPESTLGSEYFDGAISWLTSGVTGSDTVEAFWAGESCVLR